MRKFLLVLLLVAAGVSPAFSQGSGNSVSNSVAYAASKVIKATAGTVFMVSGYNSKVSAQFIQLHNSATLPAEAAVPIAVITVPASSNFSFTIPTAGMPFSTGIVVCNSSTADTKTIGSADVYFTAIYR